MLLTLIKYRLQCITIVVFVMLFSFNSYGKEMVLKVPVDTIPFIPDTLNNWGSYFTYLGNVGDSVEFEVVLFRQNPVNINWEFGVEVGVIDSAYAPTEVIMISYGEFSRLWRIIIRPDGKCILQLISGVPPEGDPAVIPIKTRYKKQ